MQFECLFTKSVGLRNNIKLAIAAYNSDRRDDITQNYGLYSDKKLQLFQKKIIRDLQSELSRVAPPKTVVFSSEHIQSRLRTPNEVTRLKSVLNQLGFHEIFIIVYLRRPAEIAASLYSTAIKCGHQIDRPPPPNNKYFQNVCDHRATIIRFREVFGNKSIIPRIYDRKEFKDGCILADFMGCLGLSKVMGRFQIPVSMNQRLSPLGIEILRRVNRKIPYLTEDGRPNPIREELIKYFELSFQNSSYTIPADLYQQYETEFYESNEWVRKSYFPERNTLFSQDNQCINSAGVADVIEEQDYDKIADLITAIWNEKSKEMMEITNSKMFRLARALQRLKTLVFRTNCL